MGLYRIDVKTGDATLVSRSSIGRVSPQWAADGKHVLLPARGIGHGAGSGVRGWNVKSLSIPTPGVMSSGCHPMDAPSHIETRPRRRAGVSS